MNESRLKDELVQSPLKIHTDSDPVWGTGIPLSIKDLKPAQTEQALGDDAVQYVSRTNYQYVHANLRLDFACTEKVAVHG